MTQENAVQVVEPITNMALVAVEIFTPEGVDSILASIKAKVAEHQPDLSTVTSRKAIASTAYKVSQSKTLLDGLGKQLNEQKRAEIGIVDAERKKLRDALDILRDETRAPLDAWEKEELAKIAAETAQREMNEAHEAALAEDVTRTQAKRIAELEAAATLAAQQAADAAEKKAAAEAAKEAAEKAEVERKANEERIRQEAAAKAKKDAEDASAAQLAAAEKATADAIAAAEKAENDRIEAEEKASADQAAAVAAAEKKAADLAAQVEADRKQKEAADAAKAAADKAESDRKAANANHQAAVNRAVLADIVACTGLTEEQGKAVVSSIAKGLVRYTSIAY